MSLTILLLLIFQGKVISQKINFDNNNPTIINLGNDSLSHKYYEILKNSNTDKNRLEVIKNPDCKYFEYINVKDGGVTLIDCKIPRQCGHWNLRYISSQNENSIEFDVHGRQYRKPDICSCNSSIEFETRVIFLNNNIDFLCISFLKCWLTESNALLYMTGYINSSMVDSSFNLTEASQLIPFNPGTEFLESEESVAPTLGRACFWTLIFFTIFIYRVNSICDLYS